MQRAALRDIFGDDGIRWAARTFVMSAQAARLIEFGWEDQINWYGAKELALLSTYFPPVQRDTLLDEAEERAEPELAGQIREWRHGA